MNDAPLSATDLLGDFESLGVTHVVGLPDNDTAPLFHLLDVDAPVRLVRVTREGEAFAIAAGLWLGGATPVVVIQNTGLLESGDGLRGTVSRMGVPLLVLVGYRGFAKMLRSGRRPEVAPPEADELVRSTIDSVAVMTEPTLEAWGVPATRLNGATDRGLVTEAFERAQRESRAVALLVTRGLGA